MHEEIAIIDGNNIQVSDNKKLDAADGEPAKDVGFDVAVDLIIHDLLC